MTDYLENSVNLIRDNFGKMLVFIGIGFLVLGALFLSQVSSSAFWISAVGIFLGIMLTFLGFLIEVDFYSCYSLTGKLGSIFVTAALVFFSIAAVSVTYREVTGFRQHVSVFRGMIDTWYTPVTNNPYTWLFYPLLTIGACLLIIGAILRIYSEYF